MKPKSWVQRKLCQDQENPNVSPDVLRAVADTKRTKMYKLNSHHKGWSKSLVLMNHLKLAVVARVCSAGIEGWERGVWEPRPSTSPVASPHLPDQRQGSRLLVLSQMGRFCSKNCSWFLWVMCFLQASSCNNCPINHVQEKTFRKATRSCTT